MSTIKDRLDSLRREMKAESIDVIIFPSTDPHNSEYVAEHWRSRTWISGFTGSAGTAVVTQTEAALWTDSRYFLQAAEELEDSGFVLMKDGLSETPSIHSWVKQKLATMDGRCAAIDGMVTNHSEVLALQKELRQIGVSVRTNYDAMRMIWKDRPAVPNGKIVVYPLEYAGEGVAEKLKRIRAVMEEKGCTAHVTTDLMNIAWTLNLRGCDVKCTPVFVAFLYIERSRAVVFLQTESLTEEAKAQLSAARVEVMPYDAFLTFLADKGKQRIMCDSSSTCFTVFEKVKEFVVDMPSPALEMKAVKNDKEIAGFRRSMLRDGVAMVKFLRWLKPAVEQGGQSEMTISEKLRELRSASESFLDLSFNTIAGYNAHGALCHYAVTEESDSTLKPSGFLLVDSGAQYVDGTTDITRTIALGPLTEEMRRVYTTVLKAHAALATLRFPEGVNGTNIDSVPRSVIWRAGMNYLHGTGHGVGSCLSVHEGPQSVRMEWRPAPLLAGMTLTNEPGVYLTDKFGVRTENTMLVVKDIETECGKFLRLEPLTLCPIDTTPIIIEMLSPEEKEWLNGYHQHVLNELLPVLSDDEDKAFLREATKAI